MIVSDISQSSIWIEEHFLRAFYRKMDSLSQGYEKVYLLAPLIGLVDGMISSLQGVAAIVESVFKGCLNFFRGEVLLGTLQIVLGAGIIAIGLVPIVVCRVIKVAVSIFVDSDCFFKKNRVPAILL